MLCGAVENLSTRQSVAYLIRAQSHDLATQNGISSSSGCGADAFGGGALGLPAARDVRSSSLCSLGPAVAPVARAPMSCIVSPITFSLERFCPDCLSSQESSWSLPSIKTGLPFFRYSPATSAVRPQKVTSTKVASSRFSPLSVV